MPRYEHKSLVFPLAGVARQSGYESAPPFTAPWAVNVRGVGAIKNRRRGGSRPGLVKVVDHQFDPPVTAVAPVTAVKPNGERVNEVVVIANGSFYTMNGVEVSSNTATLKVGDSAVQIGEFDVVFESTVASVGMVGNSGAFDVVERAGMLYLADDVLRVYDPLTGVVEPVEGAPSGCPFVALYRDRIVLGGENHVWYASRQGDPSDWDLGADMEDEGRAIAGQVQRSGRIGEKIQAMIPRGDAALVFAARNDMWLLQGDPVTGQMTQFGNGIGVLSPTAWAKAPDGTVAFLSSDGVYIMPAGSSEPPQRWSAERMPEELRDIDPDGKRITMVYDIRSRGFSLFITPESGNGEHWFFDMDNRAIWPMTFDAGMQPVASARFQGDIGMFDAVLACRDGVLRKFSNDADDDDGEELRSAVVIGPVKIADGEVYDAVLAELHGVMAHQGEAEVAWHVVVGSSAEHVADRAKSWFVSAESDRSGIWHGGRNRVVRPRARGSWAAICLHSTDQWAYETIAAKVIKLGRLRNGN